jgi:nucleoside-triphosphatase
MTKNILLTGSPGCGKTTLIKRVIEGLGGGIGGFCTQEIREGGTRRGFKMITFDGRDGILAHITIKSQHRIGKYGVDVEALDAIGTSSIRRALENRSLIVIDEIGPMELFSAAFRDAVLAALDSDCPVFGAIVKRNVPFADRIKARDDVTVIEVQPGNREALVDELVTLLQAMDHNGAS